MKLTTVAVVVDGDCDDDVVVVELATMTIEGIIVPLDQVEIDGDDAEDVAADDGDDDLQSTRKRLLTPCLTTDSASLDTNRRRVSQTSAALQRCSQRREQLSTVPVTTD